MKLSFHSHLLQNNICHFSHGHKLLRQYKTDNGRHFRIIEKFHNHLQRYLRASMRAEHWSHFITFLKHHMTNWPALELDKIDLYYSDLLRFEFKEGDNTWPNLHIRTLDLFCCDELKSEFKWEGKTLACFACRATQPRWHWWSYVWIQNRL